MRYRCIVLDPPWEEPGGCNRGADTHYPTVPIGQMPRLIRSLWGSGPESSAHMWMWATTTHLANAITLMGRLGCPYKTHAAWVKGTACGTCGGLGRMYVGTGVVTRKKEAVKRDWCPDCRGCGLDQADVQVGLGQYLRGSHELLLLGTRGKAMVPAPADRLPSVIVAPRTRHSAKPAKAYDLIERVSPGPRLELFARSPRTGWAVAGNEVGPAGATSPQMALGVT